MRAFPCQSAVAFPASLPRRSRASLLWRSLATVIPLRRLLLCHGAPASSSATAPRPAASLPLRRPGQQLCYCAPAGQQLCRSAGQQHLPDGSLLQCPGWSAASPRRPGQQHLPDGTLPHCSQPAAPPRRPGQQLRHGAPASNKPHLAEKSTPVWLAIWRTWAGFANSQLRCANFPALIYIYASIPIAATLDRCSDRRKSFSPSAPIAYATSVSPPDEAVAWPGTQVADE